MYDVYPKEGGWGWCVTAASFLIHAVICGATYACGVYHVIFKSYFSETNFVVSWIPAVMLAMTSFAGIPGTLLTYKLGYRLTTILGGLLAAGGLVLASFCHEYWQVLLGFGAMTGAGFGIALAPSVMILEEYFYEKRSTAHAIAISGTSVGVTFLPVALFHLEEKYAWKGMALILAGICANICLAGATFRPVQNVTGKRRRALLKIFQPGLLCNAAFQGICWSDFLWSLGMAILYTYLPAYAAASGMTLEEAVVIVGIVGISSLISRPMFQLFSHSAKLDHGSILLCSFGLAVLLTGLFPELFEHKAGIIGYAIIFGFHSGFVSTFVAHVSMEVIGDEHMAYGRGFTSISIGLGLIGGGPLAGWILDEFDDFKIAFYLAGACFLLSSMILTLVNLRRCYFRPLADWYDTDSESSDPSVSRYIRALQLIEDPEFVEEQLEEPDIGESRIVFSSSWLTAQESRV